MNLTDYLTSVIRTGVPILWGTALAWFVSVGILDQAAADGPGVAAGGFLVTVTIGVYYAIVRFLETRPWFPRWAAGILLGASNAPAYVRPAPSSTPPQPAAEGPALGSVEPYRYPPEEGPRHRS